MSNRTLAVVSLALILTTVPIVLARQDKKPASVSPKSELSVCSWLAGSWNELGEGTKTEERWTPAGADSMVGTCRMIKEGKVSLYEFMLIEQSGDDIELRIRHYRWNMADIDKEPIVWKLVRSGPAELIFENAARERVRRIEYRRDGDAGIICTLISIKDGSEVPQEYRFRRASE